MAAPEKTGGFRVIIAGGGIAGLALANALQHIDVDYILLEGRAEIAPQVGASIGIFANGARILDQLDCFDDIMKHVEPIDWSGDHYENGDYIIPASDGFQLGNARTGYPVAFLDRQMVLQELYNRIVDKRRILLGKRLDHVDHGKEQVTVFCKDGSSFTGDILVGADGVNSKTRQEMWVAADKQEPGAIPASDKTSMSSEYKCLYGIASPTKDMPARHADITYGKDQSSLCATGKEGRFYFFVFQKMNEVFRGPNIPKFSKEDAEAFAESVSDMNIQPKEGPSGAIKVGDVWKNRVTYTLVALEEAQYARWTWGRFVCIGDGMHKMTPNAGAGGNSALESATALANSLYDMKERTAGTKPTTKDIGTALTEFQDIRQERSAAVCTLANKLTRIQALKGLPERILAHLVMPRLGDSALETFADLFIGAHLLKYLPVPRRSYQGVLMPFNPEQGAGKKESLIKRFLLAVVPFIAIINLAVLNRTPKTATAGTIEQPSISTDYGLVYTLLLIESTRRGNALNPFTYFPSLIGILSRFYGFSTIGSIYFLTSVVLTPIVTFRALDMRLTNLRFTKSILPAMFLGYYIPLLLEYTILVGPNAADTLELKKASLRQLFPISVSMIQYLLAYAVFPDTVRSDRIHAPRRDLPAIRLIVGTVTAISTAAWWYTMAFSPLSLASILSVFNNMDAISSMLRTDYFLTSAAALLWLAYFYWDMKYAGMIQQSWLGIFAMAAITTMAAGPGATIGLGFLWREEVLAEKRHKAAVIGDWDDGREVVELKYVDAATKSRANGVTKAANGSSEQAANVMVEKKRR